MENQYVMKLSYKQIVELIHQMPDSDKLKLRKELEDDLDYRPELTDEYLKDTLLEAKHYFNKTLGKFTHKKYSDDLFFYGLAFTHSEIGYVFGFNIGFFGKSGKYPYDELGMNVLVRLNGKKSEKRKAYFDFFKKHLHNWVNRDIEQYEYPERGDEGAILARYANVSELRNSKNMLQFFKDSIEQLRSIYPLIIDEPSDLFHNVVRATPPWKLSIIDFCKDHL